METIQAYLDSCMCHKLLDYLGENHLVPSRIQDYLVQPTSWFLCASLSSKSRQSWNWALQQMLWFWTLSKYSTESTIGALTQTWTLRHSRKCPHLHCKLPQWSHSVHPLCWCQIHINTDDLKGSVLGTLLFQWYIKWPSFQDFLLIQTFLLMIYLSTGLSLAPS